MTGLALSRGSVMPILDVEGMLQRLPARVRADLAWVQKPIRDAVVRLAREAADARLLDAVARDVSEPMFRLGIAFWKAVAEGPDEWRAALMQELERERDRLGRFLQDAEAIDTLDWVIGFIRALFTSALSGMNVEELTAEADADLQEFAASENGLRIARAQLALMAAVIIADEEGDSARAHELLDLSFLNLIDFQAELRRAGYYVTPFPDATTAERRARTLASARFIREGFSEDDWQIMENARLRNLR